MSNMGYCRFENTADDLEDVYEHWDEDLSDYENEGRIRIIRIARRIVEDEGTDIE
jgi:hypothetical protein